MCTEDFPAECKNENAGCALILPNTIKTVFLEKCQHMHGREGGILTLRNVGAAATATAHGHGHLPSVNPKLPAGSNLNYEPLYRFEPKNRYD